MKYETCNFTRPQHLLTNHSDQKNNVSVQQNYLPEGQLCYQKTFNEFNIKLPRDLNKLQPTVSLKRYSDNSYLTESLDDKDENTRKPIRHSQRTRKRKLHFEEMYPPMETESPEKQKLKTSENKNCTLDSVPCGASRNPEFEIWIKESKNIGGSPEWNVWPEKYRPENCLIHEELPEARRPVNPEKLLLPDLPPISFDDTFHSSMRVEPSVQATQCPLLITDFLKLSDTTDHDEDNFDITDFMYWREQGLTTMETSEKSGNQPSISAGTFFDIEAYTEKKENLLKEIKKHLNSIKKETTKWDNYSNAKERIKSHQNKESQIEDTLDDLIDKFYEHKKVLEESQEKNRNTKKTLEHLTVQLKYIQKNIANFPENKTNKVKLISISELIRRMKHFTCFFLSSEHFQGLTTILSIESYRKNKFKMISYARNLVITTQDEFCVCSETEQKKNLIAFSKKLQKLKTTLPATQESEYWLHEKDLLNKTIRTFELFAEALKTKHHGEVYKDLTRLLNDLEQDKNRYYAHLISTAS